MELILKLMNIDPAQFSNFLPMIVLVMGLLSAVSMALSAIAKYSNNSASSGLVSVIGKVMEFGQKIVDFLSGNVKH